MLFAAYMKCSIIALLLITMVLMPTLNAATTIIVPNLTNFKRVIFYYGWLDTSNILDLDFDILVFSASTGSEKSHMLPVLQELKNERRNVEVFGYLHNGSSPVGMASSFKIIVVEEGCSAREWVSYIEQLIDYMVSNYSGLIDGVFLDECDPGIFSVTDPSDPLLQSFSNGLKEIVQYAHSKGLKVFINGVRAYASLGDYYLWEDFVSCYERDSKSYYIDTSFFSMSSSNPYEWINGIAKYEYLKRHGLLSRTIALSYAPREDPSNTIYGYYAARVLGLGGWGFADGEVFASGGPITAIPPVYDVGAPITDPVIDKASGVMKRVFVAGEVSIQLKPGGISISYPNMDTPRSPYLDGELDEGVYTVVGGASGSHSEINTVGYAFTPATLYLYINATWSSFTYYSGEGLLAILVDSDGNSSTGYTSIYTHGIGAEYLIEVYYDADSDVYSAKLYTNNGSNQWPSTELVPEPLFVAKRVGDTHVIEIEVKTCALHIEPNVSKLIALTYIDNFTPDAVTQPFTTSKLLVHPPSLYDTASDRSSWASYMGVILSFVKKGNKVIMEVSAPHGTTQVYHVYVPLPNVVKVLKNEEVLNRVEDISSLDEGWSGKKHGNYFELFIKIRHSSPERITIVGPLQGAGGGSNKALGGLAYALIDRLILSMLLVSSIAIASTVLLGTSRRR